MKFYFVVIPVINVFGRLSTNMNLVRILSIFQEILANSDKMNKINNIYREDSGKFMGKWYKVYLYPLKHNKKPKYRKIKEYRPPSVSFCYIFLTG